MRPTVSQVHINRPLTNIAQAYINTAQEYVAGRVFPVIPVDHKSDIFRAYRSEDWNRDEAEERAPATESVGSGYGFDEQTYNCRNYAFHKDISDQEVSNADDDIDLDRGATMFVTNRLLLRREKKFGEVAMKPGVWGTTLVGGAAIGAGVDFVRVSDYAASDPRALIKRGKRLVRSQTGFAANTLVLSLDAFDALQDHPDFIDRIKYTSRESITPQLLAQAFDIERVLVLGAIENKAKEGQPKNMAFVAGRGALLCHVSPTPSPVMPSAGYTFSWKHAPVRNNDRVSIKRFRMEEIESERVEGSMAFDIKVVAPEMGVYFDEFTN